MKQGTPLMERAQDGNVQQTVDCHEAMLLTQYSRTHSYSCGTQKLKKLANKDTNLLGYKSNFKANGEIWTIAYVVLGRVSSHVGKHKACF